MIVHEAWHLHECLPLNFARSGAKLVLGDLTPILHYWNPGSSYTRYLLMTMYLPCGIPFCCFKMILRMERTSPHSRSLYSYQSAEAASETSWLCSQELLSMISLVRTKALATVCLTRDAGHHHPCCWRDLSSQGLGQHGWRMYFAQWSLHFVLSSYSLIGMGLLCLVEIHDSPHGKYKVLNQYRSFQWS